MIPRRRANGWRTRRATSGEPHGEMDAPWLNICRQSKRCRQSAPQPKTPAPDPPPESDWVRCGRRVAPPRTPAAPRATQSSASPPATRPSHPPACRCSATPDWSPYRQNLYSAPALFCPSVGMRLVGQNPTLLTYSELYSASIQPQSCFSGSTGRPARCRAVLFRGVFHQKRQERTLHSRMLQLYPPEIRRRLVLRILRSINRQQIVWLDGRPAPRRRAASLEVQHGKGAIIGHN
jgi:hypothetical protein